jgi:hypothetical protein
MLLLPPEIVYLFIFISQNAQQFLIWENIFFLFVKLKIPSFTWDLALKGK